MDLVAIKEEIESLPGKEQDRIAAFLTSLRMKREGFMAEIQQRLDDDSPEKWEECEVKSQIGLSDTGADQ